MGQTNGSYHAFQASTRQVCRLQICLIYSPVTYSHLEGQWTINYKGRVNNQLRWNQGQPKGFSSSHSCRNRAPLINIKKIIPSFPRKITEPTRQLELCLWEICIPLTCHRESSFYSSHLHICTTMPRHLTKSIYLHQLFHLIVRLCLISLKPIQSPSLKI